MDIDAIVMHVIEGVAWAANKEPRDASYLVNSLCSKFDAPPVPGDLRTSLQENGWQPITDHSFEPGDIYFCNNVCLMDECRMDEWVGVTSSDGHVYGMSENGRKVYRAKEYAPDLILRYGRP